MNRNQLRLVGTLLFALGAFIPYGRWLLGQSDWGVNGLRTAVQTDPLLAIGAILIFIGAIIRWNTRRRS